MRFLRDIVEKKVPGKATVVTYRGFKITGYPGRRQAKAQRKKLEKQLCEGLKVAFAARLDGVKYGAAEMRKHAAVWSHINLPDLTEAEVRVQHGLESIEYWCEKYPYLGDADDLNRAMMKVKCWYRDNARFHQKKGEWAVISQILRRLDLEEDAPAVRFLRHLATLPIGSCLSESAIASRNLTQTSRQSRMSTARLRQKLVVRLNGVPFVDWDPAPAMRMYCGAKKRRHGQARVPVEHASKRVKRGLNALV